MLNKNVEDIQQRTYSTSAAVFNQICWDQWETIALVSNILDCLSQKGWVIYLVRWQKAEHTLGHDLADVEQQCAHLILEGKCFGVLEGSTKFSARRSNANSPHPYLQKTQSLCVFNNKFVCNKTNVLFLRRAQSKLSHFNKVLNTQIIVIQNTWNWFPFFPKTWTNMDSW